MKTSTSTHHHLILLSLFLLLTIQVTAQTRTIQDPNGDSTNLYPSYPGYSRFNSSLAIIIAVLVTSIFFMVFFFVYIRYCTAPSSSVRPPIVVRATAALRGLDASVIHTFPTFSYSEVKDHKIGKESLECAVCLNEFEDDETLRLLPKCDHVFHPECIDAWLKLHVTCPVCRADLVPRPGDHSINVIGSTGISEEGSNGEASAVDNLGSNDVVIQIDEGSNRLERPKMVNRNLSFQNLNRPGKLVVDRNLSFGNLNKPPRKTMNRNMTFANPGRMLRSLTMRPRVFDRSRSAGNLLVQPGEDLGRFTLRLPTDVRKEVMKRAALNRTKSFATTLTNGSNQGDKIGRSDREVKSDRWDFFTRALSFSLRSPRGVVEMGESSSSGPTSVPSRSLNKLRSFNCLEPRGVDETGLMSEEPVKPSA